MGSGQRNAAKRRRRVARMYTEQSGKCHYCGDHMWLPVGDEEKLKAVRRNTMATVEHIIPKADGGTDRKDNTVLSCYRCNQIRGTVRHELFAKLIEIDMPWSEIREFCGLIKHTRNQIMITVSRRNIKPKINKISQLYYR